ncbi:MAG TPA: hypothetical protein VF744_09410 [Beijerinckiaceae bacterium]|jgi:hypothetical protein
MMLERWAAAICGVLLGTGCSTLPPLPTEAEISVSDVFNAVKCELKPALADLSLRYPTLPRWAVTVGVTLLVLDNAAFEPGVELGIPIARTIDVLRGFVTVGAGVDIKSENTRSLSAKASFLVSDIVNKVSCIDPIRTTPLTSEMGLAALLDRSLPGIAGPATYAKPGNIVSRMEFVITKGADISPSVGIFRFGGPSTGRIVPSATLSGSRRNDHTLEITFTPPSIVPE